MSFSARLFVGVLLLVAAALWLSMRNMTQELVPGMRQSLEEVLVDTSNLLALLVEDEFRTDSIGDGRLATRMTEFAERRFNAVIYNQQKLHPSLIVYVTDASGTVVFDSRGRDLGRDYSRWNDVYRTLRGEYGARSTREDPDDDRTSVMYVAAPIEIDGEIAGVLTVGKPSLVVTPFVEAARRSLWIKSGWLLLVGLGVVGLLSYGLTGSVRKLTQYADALRQNRRATPPRLSEPELARLAGAMESMRDELEGKKEIERYLLALTHELKSPLAAIEGAAELLDEEMPVERRQRFVRNIRSESGRLRTVVERLLRLSELESRTALDDVAPCETRSMVDELASRLAERSGVRIRTTGLQPVTLQGEPFLLRLAIGNLLDNAAEFADGRPVEASSSTDGERWFLRIRDHGPGIPEFAHERLFERFFSLPRPGGVGKSTGLGLAAVREVAALHGGSIQVANHPEGGVLATLEIPLKQSWR